jgi:hypothetical protein
VTINNTMIDSMASRAFAKRLAALGLAAVLVGACGGGGTKGSDPNTVGDLAINPSTGSMYALQPFTIQIAGGRRPYNLSTTEPTLVSLPLQIDQNVITVTPAQPGVVDVGQDPNQVPSRRAIITVRDANGAQVNGTYDVLQNFLTGYGLSISSITSCGAGAAATTALQACAGADSLIRLVPVTNGTRFARKQMRFEVRYGSFSFVLDDVAGQPTAASVTKTADDTGAVSARIRVLPLALTQYAQFRMTDVATGQYLEFPFVITNADSASVLSVLPSMVSLVGPNTAQCGSGGFSLAPLGGRPPYTARVTGTGQNTLISPSLVNAGEAFSVTVGASTTCTTFSILITDSTGATTTASITTSFGTTAPVLPLTVSPNAVCIPDGGNATVLVRGGATAKVVNVSNPSLLNVPATGSGDFTMTLTAAGAGGAGGQFVTVTVTDGASNAAVTVTRKATCP